MPTPIRWQVPIELSPEEARVAAVLHRAGKFYVFLRAGRGDRQQRGEQERASHGAT